VLPQNNNNNFNLLVSYDKLKRAAASVLKEPQQQLCERRTTLLYGLEGLLSSDGRFGFGLVCVGRHESGLWLKDTPYKMPGQTDMS
jgi:hypothetical protein